jgi:Mrp family chromosome partitioning ATPase
MSRIADALRKARKDGVISPGQGDPADLARRSMSDVKVPWSLRGEPAAEMEPVQEPPPSNEPAADLPLYPSTPVPAYTPVAGLPPRPPTVSMERDNIDRTAALGADETVASLVHALFLRSDSPSIRHVLFTSVDDSPGAADVVIQIAGALAEDSGARVYLVDMDLNYPSLHLRFGLAGKDGLSDALKTDTALRDSAYRVESAGDLWVVPAGPPIGPLSPPRALSGAAKSGVGDETIQRRLAALIDTPDYVIAFTAAIGTYSDAELIGKLFDGVVLVVQETTASEATRRASHAVHTSKSRLLGTVLDNRVRLI